MQAATLLAFRVGAAVGIEALPGFRDVVPLRGLGSWKAAGRRFIFLF